MNQVRHKVRNSADRIGTMEFTFDVRSGMEGLRSLEAAWKALRPDGGGGGFYTDWRWHVALAEHLLDGAPQYVCIQRRDDLVGILPVQPKTLDHGGMAIPALSFPYHEHIELSDMVLGTEKPSSILLEDLLRFLHDQTALPWQCLHFKGAVDGGNLIAAAENGSVLVERRGANAYFDTRTPSPPASAKKFLRNVNRLKRKAEDALGAVMYAPARSPDGLQAAFDMFLDVEASGWKGAGGTGTAIREDPALVAFYRDLLVRFAEDGSARINLLFIGGRPAAGQICLKAGRVWHVLKIGYHEDLKDYGPGNILMAAFIEEARAAEDIDEVNLVTNPPWANRWRVETRNVYLVSSFRRSIQGRALRVAHQCMTGLSRIRTFDKTTG